MKLERGKKRSYFSVSSIKTYLKCPKCYYLRYTAGIQQSVQNERAHFGSAIHAGLASMYRGKPYRPAFVAALSRDFDKVRNFNGSAPDFEEMKREGFTMLSVYEEKRYFFGDVVAVEKGEMVQIKHPHTGEPLALPMMAKMDLVLTNGVVDHKVKVSAMDEDDMENDIQKTGYWMAFETMFGREPEFFAINQLIRRKGMPRIEPPMRLTVSEQDKVMFFNTVKDVLARIERGEFERRDSRYHDYPDLCN